MEYHLAVEENGVTIFEGEWMELGKIVLREMTQMWRDNSHMFSFTRSSLLQMFKCE